MNPEQFLQIADLFPEAVLLVTQRGQVLAANRSVQKQLGQTPRRLVGRTLYQLVAMPEEALREYLQGCARTRDGHIGAICFRNSNLTLRCVGSVIRPRAADRDALLLLRLTPKSAATERFLLLNEKLEELTREIRRRDEIQRQLREQREQLRTTLYSIGDAVIVTDNQSVITTINQVAAELTGWGNEAVGQSLRTVFNIVNEYTRQPVENPVERVLRQNSIVGLANHTLLIARDGQERPITDSAAPIFDREGRITGIVLVFRDASSQRQVERSLEESARVAETLRRIGVTLLAELDPDKVVQVLIDESTALIHAECGAFFHCHESKAGPRYQLSAFSGADAEAVSQFPLLDRQQPFQPEINGDGILCLDDITQHPSYRHVGPTPSEVPLRSYLAAPVRSRAGQIVGRLCFGHSQPARFSRRDQKIIEGLAAEAAVALDNARLYRAVQESQLRFRQLADAMPQIVWTAGADGRLDYSNQRSYEYFRLPSSQPGQPIDWLPALHPDDVQRTVSRWHNSVNTGEPYEIEYRLKHSTTGSYRWHLGRALAVRDDQGQIVRWFGTSTDIDDQKRAEQASRFLAQASAELAHLTDSESTLRRIAWIAVPTFADWSYIDLLEEDGSLRRLAIAHEDRKQVALAEELEKQYGRWPQGEMGPREVIRTGAPVILEQITDEVLQRFAQEEQQAVSLRPLHLRSFICVPLKVNRRIIGTITFLLAQSGRRFSARDLAVAEDLAGRAAVAIENANLYRALQEADRRKDEFLAMLAHELRNPLAPIRTGLELLQLQSGEDETLSLMKRQVEHLVRLVDDLLDVSRIMRGKITLRREPVRLRRILQDAVSTVRPLAESRQQSLTVQLPDEEISLYADRIRLTQVVDNLLNNACKYTDTGGQISLRTELDDQRVRVIVRDTGVGIDSEMLPHVFDLFSQSNRSIDRAQGGLGIGLTVVRSLVEMHGGQVTVHSPGEGHGSEFAVILPIQQSAVEAPMDDPLWDISPPARRILVVDDSVGAAKLLTMLLSKLGPHDVSMAHDGPSAIERARQFQPDIIFLDIGLPHMSGYEVAQQLRQIPGFSDTVLIALTGYGQDEDRRRSREAGFDEHLVKPAGMDALRSLLMHPKLQSQD